MSTEDVMSFYLFPLTSLARFCIVMSLVGRPARLRKLAGWEEGDPYGHNSAVQVQLNN